MRRFLVATTSIQLQRSLLHREFWIQLIIGRLLPVIIPLFVWLSLFDYIHTSELQGWSRHEMALYYLIIFFISLFADIHFHYEMSSMVHLGTLNQWLIRPLSFLETAASFVIAKIIILLIPGTILILVGLWLIPGLASSVSTTMIFNIIIVLPLAIVMFSMLSISIGMLSFWIIRTDSTFAMIMLVLEFLGGRLLPLSLLPSWLQSISLVFPLRYAIYLPAESILHPGSISIPLILFGQGLWSFLLFGFTVFLWKAGIRHYDAVGG